MTLCFKATISFLRDSPPFKSYSTIPHIPCLSGKFDSLGQETLIDRSLRGKILDKNTQL